MLKRLQSTSTAHQTEKQSAQCPELFGSRFPRQNPKLQVRTPASTVKMDKLKTPTKRSSVDNTSLYEPTCTTPRNPVQYGQQVC